ncbi:MAG: acetolactate synthase small subunit [Candidatus Omnitrophica bacterium 4484_213]|nr:MAG: acetolactate synthase small subunit [Candidatus Omnitrophica bacterium 4484_213]
MKHTISVLVENKPGVLARIAGLFSARGFNIDSLSVGRTEDPTISEMTVVAEGNERILEQITKQLYKLIDVIKVEDLTKAKVEFIERELILVRMKVNPREEKKIQETTEEIGAQILKKSKDVLIVEVVGEQNEIETSLVLLKQFDIQRIFRTGKIAMKASA